MRNLLLLQEASTKASKNWAYDLGFFLGSNFIWVLTILAVVLACILFLIIRNSSKTS
ncbi:MAG: hypothetical protein WCE57_06430 [Salegentibacter sp.]